MHEGVHVIKAPEPFHDVTGAKVFLAGSIEMGTAVDWQAEMPEAFKGADVTLLSPRRDDFDASQPQEASNPYFREQVEWELAALEDASAILLHFAPGTMAPISLLEFGLFARSGKLFVSCPPGFRRRGNVELVCERYEIPMAASLAEAVGLVRDILY